MRRGAILIVTTWILAILTLFAIGIGFRTGLEIKLTGYNLDKLKALYIAKAGIRKAITEKWIEYVEGKSLSLDAFSESWANNEDYFKDAEVGNGEFILSYSPGALEESGKEIMLYGLEDETGKININATKSVPLLRNLLLNLGMALDEAEGIVASIEDWRDADSMLKSTGGAEDSYYQTLDPPYFTAGQDFKTLEELLLVKGVTEELFSKIVDYITIYGEGMININTAAEEVLNAAFGIGYPELAAKIVEYRIGVDGKLGTNDDRHFTKGRLVIDRGARGLVEVKDLNDENWYGNIFGIEEREYRRIKELAHTKMLISTNSNVYRASIVASVNKVKKTVTTVFKFNPPAIRAEGFSEEIPPPDVEWLFWHEDGDTSAEKKCPQRRG